MDPNQIFMDNFTGSASANLLTVFVVGILVICRKCSEKKCKHSKCHGPCGFGLDIDNSDSETDVEDLENPKEEANDKKRTKPENV